MTVVADNYASVLADLGVSGEDTAQLWELMENQPLFNALSSPFVSRQSKHHIIEKLFPRRVSSFVKVLSDNGDVSLISEIRQGWEQLMRERENRIRATFRYVTKPDDAQVEKLKKYIGRKYGKDSVELELQQDNSLIGGFVLVVGDQVLDKSLKTSILRMQRHFAVR